MADTGLDSELDSSVGSVFFPLKACSSSKRKIRDQDFDKSCRAFDEFRGVKQLKNVVTVKGDF